jgi:hypothetical protein
MDIRLGVGLISRVELQPVSCGRGRSPSCPPGIAPLILGVCLVGPGRLRDPASTSPTALWTRPARRSGIYQSDPPGIAPLSWESALLDPAGSEIRHLPVRPAENSALALGVCLVGPGRLGDPALPVRPAESGLVVDLRAACRLFGARQDLGKRARRPVY